MSSIDIGALIKIVHELTATFTMLQTMLSNIDEKLDDVPQEKFLLERLDNMQLHLINTINSALVKVDNKDVIQGMQTFITDQFIKFKGDIENCISEDKAVQQKEHELQVQLQINEDNNAVKKEISKGNNKTKLILAVASGSGILSVILLKVIESLVK